jgi:hypothetical protein
MRIDTVLSGSGGVRLVIGAVEAEFGQEQRLIRQAAVVRCSGVGMAVGLEVETGLTLLGQADKPGTLQLGNEIEQTGEEYAFGGRIEGGDLLSDGVRPVVEVMGTLLAGAGQMYDADPSILRIAMLCHESFLDQTPHGISDCRRTQTEAVGQFGHRHVIQAGTRQVEQQLGLRGTEVLGIGGVPKAFVQGDGQAFQGRRDFRVNIIQHVGFAVTDEGDIAGSSVVPILDIRLTPQSHLQCHRLEPAMVHFIDFCRGVPFACEEVTDRDGNRGDEGHQIAERNHGGG